MGSQAGLLGSVKWGSYEQLARVDNYSHPTTSSIDSILPYDPTTVITGASDGIIRYPPLFLSSLSFYPLFHSISSLSYFSLYILFQDNNEL